jgi:hypothetical protein
MIFAFRKIYISFNAKLCQPQRMRFSAIKDAGLGSKREKAGKSVEQAYVGGTAVKLSDDFRRSNLPVDHEHFFSEAGDFS